MRTLMKILKNLFGNNTKISADNIAINTDNGGITLDNCVVIESGSNENGDWIKYNNGFMLCSKRVVKTNYELTNAWYSLFNNKNDERLDLGDYPISFISEPRVSLTYMSSNSAWIINNEGSSTDTPGKIQLCTVSSRTIGKLIIDIMAFGKWK